MGLNWYVVDKEYVSYLSNYDEKVGYVEYGERLKLHIGIIFSLENIDYYVPISSPKPKHIRMSNSKDFHKIEDATNGYLYAVVNINNMIPVPAKYVTQLKYDKIQDFRVFASDKERIDYIYLLQKEKDIIDNIASVLIGKAISLRNDYIKNPHSKLSQRCCNFPLLESVSSLFKKQQINNDKQEN